MPDRQEQLGAPDDVPADPMAENALLRDHLRRHRRLLTGISVIQHQIARRQPLETVLDCVVQVAEDVLGDPQVALYLLDPDDAEQLLLAAHRGWLPGCELTRRRPLATGAAGRAAAEGRLVVAQPYATYRAALPALVADELTAAIAAPVTEDGRVAGSLIVSSYAAGRHYSVAEREALLVLAEHVSFALNDARTVAEIKVQALHDPLTGLPNRTLFQDRLRHALDRCARGRGPGPAVLFCDLDDFKQVNDSLGHLAGDELLQVVGERLTGCVRPGDTAARLGGDEFAILLEAVGDERVAVAVADRVLETLRAPILVQGREMSASASVGIAMHADSDGDLLRAADVAMYAAKAAGRARHAVFRPAMRAQAVARLALEADLRHALDREELEVFYQPLVDLRTHRITGFEALVRWHHPSRDLVLPVDFITLAEESGRIDEIDRFVLREACGQLARWRAAHPQAGLDTVAVNLSGRQLAASGLDAQVLGALETAGLAPGRLLLEVSETTLMRDVEATRAALWAVKALGVRLALDNFGTGYSSLRYLKTFPIDALKLAKPFVDGLADGLRDDALATAIIELGRNLGLDVVAEGVEEHGQLEQLVALGCRHGQGFLFAPAMRAAAVDAALASPAPDGHWRLGLAAPSAGPPRVPRIGAGPAEPAPSRLLG